MVLATTEGHVGDGALGAVSRRVVRGDEVDPGDDTGVAAATGVVEHLDGEKLGLLCYTVREGTYCTGTVSSVAVAVRIDVVLASFLGVREIP